MLSVFIVNIPILVYGYSSLQLIAPEGRSGTSLAVPFGYAAPALRLRGPRGSPKGSDRVVEGQGPGRRTAPNKNEKLPQGFRTERLLWL